MTDGPTDRRTIGPSIMFVKKWPLEYQNVIKTYLPTILWDSNDSSDSPPPPARYDHDHRFNGFFLDPFPKKKKWFEIFWDFDLFFTIFNLLGFLCFFFFFFFRSPSKNWKQKQFWNQQVQCIYNLAGRIFHPTCNVNTWKPGETR